MELNHVAASSRCRRSEIRHPALQAGMGCDVHAELAAAPFDTRARRHHAGCDDRR